MAEDADEGTFARTPQGPQDSAAAIMLGLSNTSRERADSFLDQHAALVELQIKNLHLSNEQLQAQDAFEISHLRWRRFNDQMKGALQMMALAIVAAIAFALAAVVWNASRANGLVIESFSVPPDMAAHGITGQVVADKLLDDLNALQSATTSSRSGASFSSDWTNDIKVEIPDTGISLGEAYRYLRNWLGHDTRLSGEVYETGDVICLMARLRGGSAQTFKGKPGDIDPLVREAAEALFRAAQPYRYARYLVDRGRDAESNAILRTLTRDPSPVERAWAYGALGDSSWSHGHYEEARVLVERARAIEPDLLVTYGDLALIARDQSHAEDWLLLMRQAEQHVMAGARLQDARTIAGETAEIKQEISELLGDFQAAIPQLRIKADSGAAYTGPDDLAYAAADAARDHDTVGARALFVEWRLARELAGEPTSNVDDVDDDRALLDHALGNWRDEIAEWNGFVSATLKFDSSIPGIEIGQAFVKTRVRPSRALAYARIGNFRAAHADIDATAFDCYDCIRARGNIRAVEKNWAAAAFWFADAVKQAPDIPFAYSDWGAMLLAKGDFAGAIAKFEIASRKGPHFADPLEMWGEALIRENRSDLALAKFTEANKYAPNWGRLHLKWGEAQLWFGDKAGAGKQFAVAATLDMAPGDRFELARMRGAHG